MTTTSITSDNGVISGTTGFKFDGGNDGALLLKTTTAGGTATTALTLDTSQNATFAGYMNAPNTFGFKNRLINGAMNTWQRGTSFTVADNNYAYTADRWFVFGGVGISAAASQVASGLQSYPYALRVQRPAANSSTANTIASQVIETFNCRDLSGQTITVSFWARAGANYSPTGSQLVVYLGTGTGTDQGATAMINSTWTSQLYQQTPVTLTTSFQQFTVSFAVPTGTNEVGVLFLTNPTGTAGANDYFDITGVQLEKGSTATSFDWRPYGTELALCQRYYYKKGPTSNVGFSQLGFANIRTTTSHYPYIEFPTPMRVAPTTLDTYSIGFIIVWGAGVTGISSISINTSSPNSATLAATLSGALGTVGNTSVFLQNNATGGYVAFDAEL